MEWSPKIEWYLQPLETHALFYALSSQINRNLLDPTNHLVATWLASLKIYALHCAPVPPDFEFLKKVCLDELDYLADLVGDEPANCQMKNCEIYDHRMGLRYFLEDKLGVHDKFGDASII